MTAGDHLSGAQFFHGSPFHFDEGQIVDPHKPPPGWEHRKPYFYFAGTPEEPKQYTGLGHVYEVQPLGKYESDPHLAHIPELQSFRTQDPVRVVRRTEHRGTA